MVSPIHAITVTPTNDATVLVNTLLGPGISLVGAPTLTSGPVSAGTFTDGTASGIGIQSGILLTSGSAALVGNSNTLDGATGNFSGAGDSDLTALVGTATHDATSLNFNFTTTSGDLFFNFVFASEEYNEFTNSSFNDVFGFFVDGTNIALLPGTTTPISINNVNGGNPLGTNATNPAFFHNNDLSDGGPFFNLEYDGFTDVFTVSALGLGAGSHTIKLAIADTTDFILDSGVFIEAGSFSPTGPPITVPDAGNSLLLVLLGTLALIGFGGKFGSRAAIS
jgi:hypothetical protein